VSRAWKTVTLSVAFSHLVEECNVLQAEARGLLWGMTRDAIAPLHSLRSYPVGRVVGRVGLELGCWSLSGAWCL
jgi:hypothetical protein